ncbi:MAG: PAS domain-containing protein, partial [Gammaproteobacteria bacterium]
MCAAPLPPDDQTRRRALNTWSMLNSPCEPAVRELIASEAKYRALADASPVGVFATDAEGGCTYTNTRWQSIFGLSSEQSLGYGWSAAVHPDDKVAVTTEWYRAAAERRDFDMEYRLRHGAAVSFVRTRARPIIGESDAINGYVGTVSEITARKQQEEALRKSERFLQRTGELAGIGGWEIDVGSGKITWSDQTCCMFGVEPGYEPTLEEGIAHYAPEAQPLIRAACERAITAGEAFDLELGFVTKNGRLWVRVVGSAEFEASQPVRVVGAFQDITERVEQRRALETANERMALAANSGSIGIWDYDLATDKVNWDAWVLRLYGLPETTDGGDYDSWARLLHPEDRAAAEQAVQDAIAGARALAIDYRVVRPDGNVRHIHTTGQMKLGDDGRPLRFIGVSTDVTAMRQLSAALAAEHELLQVTLQSIGDAVIT